MFEKKVHYCPQCSWQFQEQLSDGMELRCPHCSAEFRALVDDTSGAATLLRQDDAGGQIPQPLYLPKGSIRAMVSIALAASCWILVIQGLATGFILSAVALAMQGRFDQEPVLGFYLILAGLLVGHIYGRATAGDRGASLVVLLSHVKGLVVLATAAGLTTAYLTGWHADWPGWAMGILSAIISFYFGSR
ncbi:MAG: hypothetical protein ACLFUJ_06415 [Phycisphaerae bacterium]